MDKKVIQNLSVATLVEIVEDLSFITIMKDRDEEVDSLKNCRADRIEDSVNVERLKHSSKSDIDSSMNCRADGIKDSVNIEQLQTDHNYAIQKLHKEYGETILQLRDEFDETIKLHEALVTEIQDDRGLTIRSAQYNICREFEAEIIRAMTIALENSEYNLESREYKTLLHLVEVMDTQLIFMNITSNFQGRILSSIKKILSSISDTALSTESKIQSDLSVAPTGKVSK